MEKATAILSGEHANILKVIDALLREVSQTESGKEIRGDFFEKGIKFIKEYADTFHHNKEEDILFVELGKEGVLQHCNPIGQMLHEHNLGRDFVKGIEEALATSDSLGACKNARGYCELLQEHIFKEDNILYPMADEALSEEVQKSILDRFSETEAADFKEEDWI